MTSPTLQQILNADLALSLFQESNDAFVVFDPVEETILEVNPAMRRISGLKRNQLINRPLTDVFDGSQHGSLARLLQASRETGFFHAQEGFALIAEGDRRVPLNVSVSRIHVEPAPLGLLVARDISDRVAAEEKLRKREQEVDHFSRLSILGELVSTIVHEIRQPVFAIRNYTQTCQMGVDQMEGAAPAAVSKYLERIVAEADRCDAIIRELHNFSSRVSNENSLLNLNDLIRESQKLLGFELRQSRARLLLDLNDPLPVVRGSTVQLQQVIMNLIRNSVQAISEADVALGNIQVSTHADGSHVVIQVRDNGCGIAAAIRETAFRPFVTSRENGLGMGLAISQRIVEFHEGTIRIADSSEAGTTIEVRLPVVK